MAQQPKSGLGLEVMLELLHCETNGTLGGEVVNYTLVREYYPDFSSGTHLQLSELVVRHPIPFSKIICHQADSNLVPGAPKASALATKPPRLHFWIWRR